MKPSWRPSMGLGNYLFQSSIPTIIQPEYAGASQGLFLRGVVIKSYVYDSSESPVASETARPPNSVYCDVLLYGQHKGVLPRCMVMQPRGGIHEGSIWIPRETTFDVSGGTLDLNTGTNPASMDGDHVVVTFLENDMAQPIIVGGITHPSSDIGNSGKEIGKRLRLRKEDGTPNFVKHRGCYWGVDTDGNFTIDLSGAHSGILEQDGKEPTTPEDGEHGNLTIKLPKNTTFKIQLGDDRELEIVEDGDKINLRVGKIDLGDGASEPVVLGTTYTTARAQMNAQLTAVWTGLGTYLAALATALGNPATGASFDTFKPVWIAALAAVTPPLGPVVAASAITSFEGAASTYLSTDVKTR